MNRDWLTTTRQSIPRLAQLLSKMRPTYRFEDVSSITDDWLKSETIEGVIWDVDGTLMEYHAGDIAAPFREQIRAQFRSGVARHAILSNCGEDRFLELGGMFPEIPIVRGYRLGEETVFRSRIEGIDSHSQQDLDALFAAGGYQVRKPDGGLVEEAARVLEIGNLDRVVMVGDQYLTDIASANLASARSVKVPTFRQDTFPVPVKASQSIEALLFRVRYPRG